MKIQKWTEEAKAEGIAQFFVVYANIGNDADELIVCEPYEADEAGCEIVDIYYIKDNENMVTAVITAEAK